MPIKLANNASGTLATAISASDTGIALTTGDGAEFPTLGAGDYFYATITSSGGAQEIVKATARSGDSLTVVRAQEGTSAAGFAAGARFELRVTAASVDDLVEEVRTELAASSGSSLVGFLQAGTNAVPTTVQAKLRETVSVFDFLPAAQISLIQSNNTASQDATAVTAGIQAAVNSGARTIYLPQGTYSINNTIRQATNGYALCVIGENKYNSRLKAVSGMSVPVLWVGNSNGHGNYRGVFENFAIEGSTVTGCHGLVLQEAGNSRVRNLRIQSCDYGIFAPGMIGASIRDCEMGGNNFHINMTAPAPGTPSSIDDTTTTAGPLTLHTNINIIDSIWMAGGGVGVSLEGGLCRITGCTFQSVGNSATSDCIRLIECNESFDYGGGPIVDNCWFEGGTYRSMVYVYETRAARIKNCFMSGNTTASEAAIIAYNAHQIIIEGNSIRDAFTATPTDGRTVNAPIYVYANNTFAYRVRDNYITNPTGAPYFQGEAFPNEEKEFWPVAAGSFSGTTTTAVNAGSFSIGRSYKIASAGTTDFTLIGSANNTVGTIFVATGVGTGTGTATTEAGVVNSYQFTSLTRLSTGRYRCNTSGKFNISNPSTAMYSLTVIGNIVAFPNVTVQGNGYVEVKFYDAAGAVVDPEAWSLIVYAQPVGQGS